MHFLRFLDVGQYIIWLQKYFKVRIMTFLPTFIHYQLQFGRFCIEGIRIIATSISFRIPFDHVGAESEYELLFQISEGVRPKLENNLSEAMNNFLTRFSNIFHPDYSSSDVGKRMLPRDQQLVIFLNFPLTQNSYLRILKILLTNL